MILYYNIIFNNKLILEFKNQGKQKHKILTLMFVKKLTNIPIINNIVNHKKKYKQK